MRRFIWELWGGHPGTANRRVTPNGRTTYPLPNVAGEHCSHSYPTIRLKLTDLVEGHNALQFACDQGTTFWGHFIVDNACLPRRTKADHPDLKETGLNRFKTTVAAARSKSDPEHLELSLNAAAGDEKLIASVDFEGYYHGYDENGDGRATDWHGFTKHRQSAARPGNSDKTALCGLLEHGHATGAAKHVRAAVVHFRDRAELIYITPSAGGLSTSPQRESTVTIHHAADVPAPFWSRASRKRSCTIHLDTEPARIEQAELHVVVWDGGAGQVTDYFTLNGRPLPVAGTGRHDVLYSRLILDPTLLAKGPNRIELLSDTEHHGIEVLLPGHRLVVRTKK